MKLAPCPFCGNTKLFVGTEMEILTDENEIGGGYTVCCDYTQGGCGATSGYRETKEEAISVWNKRVNNE